MTRQMQMSFTSSFRVSMSMLVMTHCSVSKMLSLLKVNACFSASLNCCSTFLANPKPFALDVLLPWIKVPLDGSTCTRMLSKNPGQHNIENGSK